MKSSDILIGRYPIIVCVTIVLHLIWAAGLALDPQAINATGLSTVLIATRSPAAAGWTFLGVGLCAVVGLFVRSINWRVGLILPQQVILWFSVVGAMHAMYLGQFADGVFRSHWFLIVDQVPVVLIAFGHTAALFFIAAESRRGQ